MILSKEELAKFLVEDWNYKEKQVEGVVEKLFKMDDSIQQSFDLWLDNGEMPEEPVFTGCSPKTLMETYPIKPPAIFMLLDWIRREPKEALSALQSEYDRLPEPKTPE